jgi:hypothetical protein
MARSAFETNTVFIARRLVGDQNFRIHNQCPRDCDALHLSA